MKDLKTALKTCFSKWKATLIAFCKHPIQFTTDYCKNFKTLSKEEKTKKIIGAVLFVAATVYAFQLVIGLFAILIFCIAIFGSAPIEVSRQRRAEQMVEEFGGKESDYL